MNPKRIQTMAGTALLLTLLSIGLAYAAEPALSLKPSQVQSLGIQVQLVSDKAPAWARHPGVVVLPSGQQRMIAAPLPGLIEALHVSVGDSVRAGQVLVALRSAQAQELARDVLTTDSQSTLANAAQARDEQLFKEGLIPQSRLDLSRAQAQQSRAHAQERRRALQQPGASVDSVSGTIKLAAPISGVVLERSAAVGQRVDQATPLLRIATLSPLWVEMQVPAADAPSVQIGSAIQVVGSQAQGRVTAIGHVVDAHSQSVLVRAEIKPGQSELRIGQAVEVQLARSDATATAQLPAAAVVDDGGQTIVFVEAAPGQYRRMPVQLVSTAGNSSSVRGLAANSKVVVQGTAALKSLLAAAQP